MEQIWADDDEDWQRERYLPMLERALDWCADTWMDDQLPPMARLSAQDDVWRERFSQCFLDLAAKCRKGEWPFPGCTGEEMALHLALVEDEFDVDADDVLSPTNPKGWTINYDRAVPIQHTDGTKGWRVYGLMEEDAEFLKDLLLEDEDVLMLFDMQNDGFQNNNPAMGYANLNPPDWFVPFRKDS